MSSVCRPHGRLFQIRGPAALKLLSPKLLCVRGTTHVVGGRPKGSSVAFRDEMACPYYRKGGHNYAHTNGFKVIFQVNQGQLVSPLIQSLMKHEVKAQIKKG